MQTLQQIRADSELLFREKTGGRRFSPEQWNGFINKGQEYLATVIEYPVDMVAVTSELNVGAYNLPSDNMIIRKAFFGTTTTKDDINKLNIVNMEVLTTLFPNWLDATIGNAGQPRYMIVLDKKTVYIHPRPDSTYVGKDLILHYVYSPSAMVAEGDTPDIPVPYHTLLKFYACFLAYEGSENPEMAKEMKEQLDSHRKEIESVVTREVDEPMRFKWTGGWD